MSAERVFVDMVLDEISSDNCVILVASQEENEKAVKVGRLIAGHVHVESAR